MGLLNRPAGQNSSLYLKPRPVRMFKDGPFSSYIVAAFESDKGLVFLRGTVEKMLLTLCNVPTLFCVFLSCSNF